MTPHTAVRARETACRETRQTVHDISAPLLDLLTFTPGALEPGMIQNSTTRNIEYQGFGVQPFWLLVWHSAQCIAEVMPVSVPMLPT